MSKSRSPCATSTPPTTGRVKSGRRAASVAVDAAKAPDGDQPDAHVTEQRARLDTADALLSARECADRRDIAGARRVLESQKAKIAALKVAAVTGGLVERLAHDLAVVLEGLANEDAYRRARRQWMTSKMMGHQMQRCMEDSDSDEEETSMPRLTGSVGRARNVYRNARKEIVQGRDDARDVSQETFCTSTYKSGAGVLHSTGLGGVMVASLVRGGLAPGSIPGWQHLFRRTPSTREPPPQVQPRRDRHLFLHPHRRPARASSRPSFAKVKLRSRTRTGTRWRSISNLTPAPSEYATFKTTNRNSANVSECSSPGGSPRKARIGAVSSPARPRPCHKLPASTPSARASSGARSGPTSRPAPILWKRATGWPAP